MTFIPRPKQQEILAYTGGKMGVAAVPGSGKTETLSQLAAQIINRGVLDSRQEVLIVTLVNSAVDSFRARIRKLTKEHGLMPYVGYRVRTLHGLAHDIVRERPALVGLSEKFKPVGEETSQAILNDSVATWLRDHPHYLDDYLSTEIEASRLEWARRDKEQLPKLIKETALAFIRLAKDLQSTPDTLRELLVSQGHQFTLATMGAEIYADYQRSLAYQNRVDFDDLIRLALQALNSDDELLMRLRRRWPYILEDEAQDSSRLQERILRLLAGPAGNWVRVGDPNQAIFETFTTASPEHLRRFLLEQDVAKRELPNSGRSTRSIIALANHLIDWTRHNHPLMGVRDALSIPHILPTPPDDPQPNPTDDPDSVFLIANKYSPDREVWAVTTSLSRWLPNNPDSTIAVLVSRKGRGIELEKTLREHGIEVEVSLLGNAITTREAASTLATVLHCLADPTAPAKLANVYEVWHRDLCENEVAWRNVQGISKQLSQCMQVEDYVWPRVGRDWLDEVNLNDEERTSLEEFRALIQRWQGAVLLPIDQIILTLAQDLFSRAGDLALAHNLAVILEQAVQQEPTWRLPELAKQLTDIADNRYRVQDFGTEESGFDPQKYAGKVVIATMHKAKGLEWDRVYLMSVNSYDFPSGQPYDQYIAEKWFLRASRQVQTGGPLNLQAEALAQLAILADQADPAGYVEGEASRLARLDYVRERLRLLYVGITRARKELVITWNTGRPASNQAELTQALPFVALQAYWERERNA